MSYNEAHTENEWKMEDPFGLLLQQVHQMHFKETEELGFKLNTLHKEMQNLKATKIRLEEDIKSGKQQIEELLLETQHLHQKIKHMEERPKEVCRSCLALRQQVKNLTSFKEQIVKILHDCRTGSKREDMDTLANTIDTIYTQISDVDGLPEEELAHSSSAEAVSCRSTDSKGKCTETDRTQLAAVDKTDSKLPLQANAPLQTLRLKRSKKRHRLKEESPPDSKRLRLSLPKNSLLKSSTYNKGICVSESPTCESLTDSAKDTETVSLPQPVPLVPDTCDISLEMPRGVTSGKHFNAKTISDTTTESKETKTQPVTIIPETMQMDLDPSDDEQDGEGEEDEEKDVAIRNEEGEDSMLSQPLTDQTTVQCLQISPPSHSSTPVSTKHRSATRDASPSGGRKSIPLLEQGATNQPVHMSSCSVTRALELAKSGRSRHLVRKGPASTTDSQSNEDDLASEPSSPIFRRKPVTMIDGKSRACQSPSLFDENDGLESALQFRRQLDIGMKPGIEGDAPGASQIEQSKYQQHQGGEGGRRTLRLNDDEPIDKSCDADVSHQSNPSPSVLSGRNLRSLPATESDGWLSKPTSVRLQGSSKARHAQQNLSKRQSVGRVRRSNERRTDSEAFNENSEGKVGPEVTELDYESALDSVDTMLKAKILQENSCSTRRVSQTNSTKSMKQMTISESFNQPQKSPRTDCISGAALGKSDLQLQEEQELRDLEKAVQMSLEDIKNKPDRYDPGLTINEDPDLTGPKYTSTPYPGGILPVQTSDNDDGSSDSSVVFKKPAVTSTPRLTKARGGPKSEIRDLHMLPKAATGRVLSSDSSHLASVDCNANDMDTMDKSPEANSEITPVNGSLGPDVRLSELDPDESLQPEENHFQEPVSFIELYAEDSATVSQKGHLSRQAYMKDAGGQHIADDAEASFPSTEYSEQHGGLASRDDSFDQIPQKHVPDFAHVAVVRKRAERQQLETYACTECDRYYGRQDMTEEERKERMKNCRHKARYVPPGTPEHFWSIGFPDTQVCEERGYLNKTQHKPSDHRQQRKYRQLFTPAKDKKNSAYEVHDDSALFDGDDSGSERKSP